MYTYGAKKSNSSMDLKLILNPETRQFEWGQATVNGGHHIDKWVTQKELKRLKSIYEQEGWQETTKRFGE